MTDTVVSSATREVVIGFDEHVAIAEAPAADAASVQGE